MTENTTDIYIHLSPEARAVIDEPDHVRIAFMRHERFVVHPAVAEVLNEAAWMIGSESGVTQVPSLLLNEERTCSTTPCLRAYSTARM